MYPALPLDVALEQRNKSGGVWAGFILFVPFGCSGSVVYRTLMLGVVFFLAMGGCVSHDDNLTPSAGGTH